jgi:hypothetical protein
VEIFDKFFQKEIVRETGSIRKCFDDYYEGILISDELRKVKSFIQFSKKYIICAASLNVFIFLLFIPLFSYFSQLSLILNYVFFEKSYTIPI